MKKFRFREFQIYKDTCAFRKELKKRSRKFPKEEQFALTNQLWRALDSIVLNIAEGADRGTDKDFAHYLNNAHTSLNEVVGCLDLVLDDGYISDKEHLGFLKTSEKLANQLTAFRRKLLADLSK